MSIDTTVKNTLFSQDENVSLPRVIVVDETCILVSSQYYYLYTAYVRTPEE